MGSRSKIGSLKEETRPKILDELLLFQVMPSKTNLMSRECYDTKKFYCDTDTDTCCKKYWNTDTDTIFAYCCRYKYDTFSDTFTNPFCSGGANI